jgi:hypothetical protein
MTVELPAIIAAHISAVNAFDTDAIVRTFSADAYVNDNRREIVGAAAIQRWVAKELVGDKVTMQVRRVREHYGEIIVDALYNGDYDKTNLPDEVVLTNYFRLLDGKIASLIIIFNRPSPF